MPDFVRDADGRVPIAVFLSGRGSNFAALAEAAEDPAYPARIVLVLSDKVDAKGLDLARAKGIATAAVARRDYDSRDAFDSALEAKVHEAGAQLICLAGFMRILGRPFVERWEGRMLNIHPSLLPAYRGLDTHARALADGVAEHGVTVHLVTPELDDGPALAQARVPVRPDDTPDTLAQRVLVEEHKLYPAALAAYLAG
ncbi:phosphoribosylglycinamide formyltransferase [Acuticoccus sediminis]|uniref:Phosphoribosylglycinamide formyltransferase n=1 Tax=Acuticoccus sediminis TaxID=2184697 RepID=A0A8B2NP71_9HYPH|nr:phosphoribosylglycinamide formyltransferase [Acuticoccus sediminis]RAI00482.1 phosphoribosylglycinamide formyltransferase [Acuticoccus sediminis]